MSFQDFKTIREVMTDFQNKLSVILDRKVTIDIRPKTGDIAQWDILVALCDAGGVTPLAVLSQSRQRDVVNVRFLTCYYIHHLLGDTQNEIAQFIKRDRTTVLNAIKQVTNRIEIQDEDTLKIMALVENRLSKNFLINKNK